MSGNNEGFASTLIKKLRRVAFLNKIIRRNLHSIHSRIARGKQRKYHQILLSETKKNKTSISANFDSIIQDHVPQKEWDDLFESAFLAIGNAVVDIFDSKEL